MNLKNLLVLTLTFAACQNNAPSNIENVKPSPTVAVQSAPANGNSDNVNISNAANVNLKSGDQTPKPSPTAAATPKATASPTAATKYKNYTAKGIVKGVDVASGSITIDHEDIGDYMVGMEMPFPVVNRDLLKNLKVGDQVEFVLETGVGVERIIKIRKK